MRSIITQIAAFILMLFSHQVLYTELRFNQQQIDAHTQSLSFIFEIPEGDFIYKDYLDFTVDSPNITLSEWHSNRSPIEYYDSTFKATKKIYTKTFTITVQAKSEHLIQDQACVHATYYQHSQKKSITQLFPLFQPQSATTADQNIYVDSNTTIYSSLEISYATHEKATWQTWLTLILEYMNTWWFKGIMLLFFIFFLYAIPKIYGISLVITGITLYTINLMLPAHIMLWLMASCGLCIGLYLLIASIRKESRRWYLSLLAILLIAGSIIGFAKAYSYTYLYRHTMTQSSK